jgi:hypothetical protein
MSDETEVGIAPDAETVLAPTRAAGFGMVAGETFDYPPTPAAWSSESVELLAEVERRTWSEAALRAAGIAAGALITAVLIAAAGLAIIMAKPGQELSVTVPQTPGVNPGAVKLPAAAPPSSPLKTADPQPDPALNPDNHEYIAVALSPAGLTERNIGGWAASGSQQRAETLAVAECKTMTKHSDCVLVSPAMFHGCVAYAIDGSEWAGGIGNTKAEAIANAQKSLGVNGAYIVHCSTPPGQQAIN